MLAGNIEYVEIITTKSRKSVDDHDHQYDIKQIGAVRLLRGLFVYGKQGYVMEYFNINGD